MSKAKAGKKAKGKAKARKYAPRRRINAAPQAASAAPAETVEHKAPPEYPWNVIVHKGADRLPVTVSDRAHYERLCTEFGAKHIEVQS